MYNIRRSLLGLATIIGITAMAGGTPMPNVKITPQPDREPRRRGKSKKPLRFRLRDHSYNKYAGLPQGERECVRRIGGRAYEEFKARDRVRRGLPAQK